MEDLFSRAKQWENGPWLRREKLRQYEYPATLRFTLPQFGSSFEKDRELLNEFSVIGVGYERPIFPPGQSLEGNIEEFERYVVQASIIEELLRDSVFATLVSRLYLLYTFFEYVRGGGKWDYKVRSLEKYETAGNFNYGFMGAWLQIPDKVLLIAAGVYQQYVINKNPQRFNLSETSKWGSPWAGSPYGDQPEDQISIRRGIDYLKSGQLIRDFIKNGLPLSNGQNPSGSDSESPFSFRNPVMLKLTDDVIGKVKADYEARQEKLRRLQEENRRALAEKRRAENEEHQRIEERRKRDEEARRSEERKRQLERTHDVDWERGRSSSRSTSDPSIDANVPQIHFKIEVWIPQTQNSPESDDDGDDGDE